jgi:hypothetical protein
VSSSLPDDLAVARIALGREFRALGHAISGHHVSTAELGAATLQLAEIRERIAAGDRRTREIERPNGDWGPAPGDGEEMFSFDERPVSGRAAPYGLDVRIVRHANEAVGLVTLGAAHEGAPGRSHGGIVSALFDDVFGFVLTIEGQAAFTGTLTIRYEHGVPIGIPLECRVRLDRREGRKLFMSGELSAVADGAAPEIVTRSTAIFIAIPEGIFGSGA